MGLDLKLLPFQAESEFVSFSHTILDCFRRRDLFEKIQGLPSEPVPENFQSYLSRDHEDGYEDTHYGKTTHTPYGERLTWVYATDLVRLADHPDVLDNHWNRAIWRFLMELPNGTKVALFWS